MSWFIPALVGGIVSGYGQYRANKETKNYLTSMSNTGYQRAMADMKAAGLNPMLASKLGPASTPNYQAGNIGGAAVSGFNQGAAASASIASAKASSAQAMHTQELVKQAQMNTKMLEANGVSPMEVIYTPKNIIGSELYSNFKKYVTGDPVSPWMKAIFDRYLPDFMKNQEIALHETTMQGKPYKSPYSTNWKWRDGGISFKEQGLSFWERLKNDWHKAMKNNSDGNFNYFWSN